MAMITVEQNGIAFIVPEEEKVKWVNGGYTVHPNSSNKKRKKVTVEAETEEKEG